MSWGIVKDALSSEKLQQYILQQLEKNAVKILIKKFLISGGFKGWLVKFVVEELVEEVDEHLLEPAFQIVGYHADTLEGAKIYKKVQDAETVNDWLNSLGDV